MNLRLYAVPILAFMLDGCSSSYDITAYMIEGRVLFEAVAMHNSELQTGTCARSISISSVAEPGESEQVWEWHSPNPSGPCLTDFPIRYGVTPIGAVETVAARPLIPGVTYDVDTSSPSSTYGTGRFRLSNGGRVDNQPR